MLNDEVPGEGDFDAERRRGEFDGIAPADFVHGGNDDNPPGWLSPHDIDEARARLPIVYVEVVPVRINDIGRICEVGSLLRVRDNGSVERTLIAGRVLFHETIREAIARNIAKDLGNLALPIMPVSLQPFTVAEFFPTPGISEFYDSRQHAIELCYVVPISGDCKPLDSALDVEWCDVESGQLDTFVNQMVGGHGQILRRALCWGGVGN